jgi:hypothetical protein
MIIRPATSNDMEAIRSLHERSPNLFVLPNFSDMLGCTVVEDDNGKILGFGSIRLTSEAILILDHTSKAQTRVLRDILMTLPFVCKKFGLKDTHVFLTGDHQYEFKKILKKHYGFVGHTGEVLVLNVED